MTKCGMAGIAAGAPGQALLKEEGSFPRGETDSGCPQWGKFKPQRQEGRDTEERVHRSWLVSLKSKLTLWMPVEDPRVPKMSGTGLLHTSPQVQMQIETCSQRSSSHTPTIIPHTLDNTWNLPKSLLLRPSRTSFHQLCEAWEAGVIGPAGKERNRLSRQITRQGLWLINGKDESVTQLSDKIQFFYWMHNGFYFPSMKYVKHVIKISSAKQSATWLKEPLARLLIVQEIIVAATTSIESFLCARKHFNPHISVRWIRLLCPLKKLRFV